MNDIPIYENNMEPTQSNNINQNISILEIEEEQESIRPKAKSTQLTQTKNIDKSIKVTRHADKKRT